MTKTASRDPGKLFSNAGQVVTDSVKRSQFAVSAASGSSDRTGFGISSELICKSTQHTREYLGIPRSVKIDPAMNHDLRITESTFNQQPHGYLLGELNIPNARRNSALALFDRLRYGQAQTTSGILGYQNAATETLFVPETLKRIEKDVYEAANRPDSDFPSKFVCPEVTPYKPQPDRFVIKPVIELHAVGDEDVPKELTDVIALISSRDTILINP